MMKKYKTEFIEFLIKNDALKFGKFKLKSGRISPYFINTGEFFKGDNIRELGSYYVDSIFDNFGDKFDVLFGPAYKGMPLCVAGVVELSKRGFDKGYCFNRKEVKDHGEKGVFVGAPLGQDTRVIIVDDVITAGTALRDTFKLLKENGDPIIKGISISVDRKEKGFGNKSAVQEIENITGVKVSSIVDIDDIIEYFDKKGNNEIYRKIKKYREKFGV